MKREERLSEWAGELDEDSMIGVIVQLADFAVEAEMVSFSKDCLAPYWSHTGDPLVAGQICYSDDE